MANLEAFSVNWNEIEESSFEPIPVGSYAAKITNSEIKDTKKGDKMLSLTFDVLGKFKGRKIFETFMMTHSNPKCVQAGLGRIKSMAKCIDIDFDQLQDTSEFHGKPVGIKVKIEKSDEYGDKNKIQGFFEFSEDLLDDNIPDELPEESEVSIEEEPDVVPDEVEEVEEDAVDEESTLSPSDIQAFKKDELLQYIKDIDAGIVCKGKTIKVIKEELIELLFSTEVEEEEEIVIE